MSSIFEKALSTCDIELLETLKNTPEFSYEHVLSYASSNHSEHIFEWLKNSGYVFNDVEINDAIKNAVLNNEYYFLNWFKHNNYDVGSIILNNFEVEQLDSPILEWMSENNYINIDENGKIISPYLKEDIVNDVLEEKNYKIIDSPVKLISWTQSPEHKNLLDIVAYCARVSNPSNQMNTETNEKLALYMWKNEHFSPFEIISVCLEINTTRDIARQILRHRSFSFQEFSQRYAVADLGFTKKEARIQDKKNRQNSIETDDENLKLEWDK